MGTSVRLLPRSGMLLHVGNATQRGARFSSDAGPTAAGSTPSGGRLAGLFAGVGVAGLAAAAVWSPSDAEAAASQDWSPFVLVAGLLLIGLAADDDGLFAAAGNRLARITGHGGALFVGATVVVGVVTALLNLDTSVAFLTPVMVYTAASRGGGEAPLLYGCLLLSNAGSLFLPGSNLTNLIVLGHLHLTGAEFLSHMWAPALSALVVTAVAIGLFERRALGINPTGDLPRPERPVFGTGIAGIVAATGLVVVLRSPALPVALVGVALVGVRLATGRSEARRAIEVLGAPVLVGLFGVAVTLGTIGRVWSGPAALLTHLDMWGTAGFAAVSTVLVNNLPAASLLAAHTPARPFALLVGLNLAPNLFVTGSLAWVLWLQAARTAGTRPSITRASRLGLVAVPAAMVAALGVLSLTGSP